MCGLPHSMGLTREDRGKGGVPCVLRPVAP